MVLLPVWGAIEDAKYGAGSALGQFLSGVNNGVKSSICSLYRNYPNWIQQANPLNGFYRGFMDSACRLPDGLAPTPRPQPQFQGGQCDCDRYRIRFARTLVKTTDGSTMSDEVEYTRFGPITGYRVTPQEFAITDRGRAFTGDQCSTLQERMLDTRSSSSTQRFVSFSVISLVNLTRSSDPCGSPDPYIPPFTEPPPEERTFDFDISVTVNNNTVNIPISLGPITPVFAPEFSFAPTFSIPIGEPGDRPQDRLPTTLTPDGLDLDLDEIRRRLQENQDQLQRNNTEILDNKEKLEDLLACVCVDLARTIEVQLCDQETPSVELSSTGTGLLGILNFLVLLNSGANIRHAELCQEDPVPPAQLPPLLIASGTSTFSNRAELVQVGPEVVSIQLRITEYDRKLVPIFSVDDSQGPEGKFGSLSIGLADDVVGGGVFQAIYTTSTVVRLPGHLKNRGVRIGLKPGISWQLYDTGERGNG